MKKHLRMGCLLAILFILIASLAYAYESTESMNSATSAITYLRSTLKNPQSLQINEVYDSGQEFYVFDISAMNGFGGYTRSTYMVFKQNSSSSWSIRETNLLQGSFAPYVVQGNANVLLLKWESSDVKALAAKIN